MCVEARMTLGMLRSSLQLLRENLTRLLPYLKIILERVCAITYDDYRQGHAGWIYRWKVLSQNGYDVHKNRWVDYGNAEYASLFGFLYLHDDSLKKYLDFLITYWPSLGPSCNSEHAYSMKGDVLEICLAALRGDQLFVDHFKSTLVRDGLTLPEVSDYLVQLCRFLHLMNASLVTGRLKWNDRKVAKLSTHMPFLDDPFVQIWAAFRKTKNQGICLACLFSDLNA